jgi:hypothetical protein
MLRSRWRRTTLRTCIALAPALAACHEREGTAPRPSSTVDAVDDSADIEVLMRRRARDAAHPPQPLLSHPGSKLARELLSEADARRLCPQLANSGYVYEPDGYYRHAPLRRDAVPFPELPGGRFELVTDARGLREDPGRVAPAGALLAIVAGDSHADGVCSNAHSFANLAEARLCARDGLPPVDVWNAAVGGQSLFHYLGVFERFRSAGPRAFVVCVYGGNDFAESARLWRWFRREPPVAGSDDLFARIEQAFGRDAGALGRALQGHAQAYALARHPELESIWSKATLAVSADLAAAARASRIEPVFLYLPPALDAQPVALRSELDPLSQALGLDGTALHAADRLADAWIAALADAGERVLDLRPLLAASSAPAYWRADLHLSEHGHALVAAALAERLDALMR